MKTIRLALLGVTLAAVLAPVASQASHCGGNVIIFSGYDAVRTQTDPMGIPSALNGSSGTCAALDHDADGRKLNPGADAIYVRLIRACSLGDDTTPAETIEGHITGLGLDQDITLTCNVDPLLGGTPRFHSPWLAIDPTVQGCITATVGGESGTFHTVGEPLGCL